MLTAECLRWAAERRRTRTRPQTTAARLGSIALRRGQEPAAAMHALDVALGQTGRVNGSGSAAQLRTAAVNASDIIYQRAIL